MTKLKIPIQGMSCASCVARIEKAVKQLPEVKAVAVNLATETASVDVAAETDASKVVAAIRAAGYQVAEQESYSEERQPQRPSSTIQAADAQLRQKELRDVIGAALLSTPLVFPMLFEVFNVHLVLPAVLQLILATPVQFIFGWRFYKNAFAALRARTGNMDLLVALGTSAAYGLSLYLMYAAQRADDVHTIPHLYFESAAVVFYLAST
jgi:Cu+-exporting ATPase